MRKFTYQYKRKTINNNREEVLLIRARGVAASSGKEGVCVVVVVAKQDAGCHTVLWFCSKGEKR